MLALWWCNLFPATIFSCLKLLHTYYVIIYLLFNYLFVYLFTFPLLVKTWEQQIIPIYYSFQADGTKISVSASQKDIFHTILTEFLGVLSGHQLPDFVQYFC